MKKETRNGLLTGLALSAASGLLNPVVKGVVDTIVNGATFTIDITSAEFNLSAGIKKYFKNIPDKLHVNIGSEFDNGMNLEYTKNVAAWDWDTSDCSSTIIWEGVPITFKVVANKAKDNSSGSNQITLSTINVDYAKKKLRKFIKLLVKIQHDYDMANDKTSIVLYKESLRGSNLVQLHLPNFKRRTFENTFIPMEQEMLIKNSIDEFINKRDWYIKNNIPYHFGFLLYSGAGTGKSSVAQAIADYANAQLISIPGDNVGELPKMLGEQICSSSLDPSSYRVILIEDIDCGFAEKSIETIYDDETNSFKSVDRKVGLASILNALDGLAAPDNAIYVFTTNHIEKLDPALIRPGRCDVKINIPGVTNETLARFIQYHYNESITIDESIKIKEGLTFAELQTLVMKGYSFNDLITYSMEV